MYSYLQSLEKFGINLGLERINFLLEKLGNPHQTFKSIHIAGTNGKGSTAAMVSSILKEAGYKVGLYTSPHVFDYTERIKINGQDISRKDFEKGLCLVKRIAEKPRLESGELFPTIHCGVASNKKKMQLTVFEVLTAAAFWYFARKKVDYAVIEVGLGGRLDATNVLKPLVSVITNIDLEHTEVLGKSLPKIAREKAAIIKPGVPVVTAERKSEALRVIKKAAEKQGSLLISVSCKSLVVGCKLIGEHQKLNAACAVSSIRLAKIIVSRAQIHRGLRKTKWPGRFQVLSKKPLIIVDGAHNPAGAKVLCETIHKVCGSKRFTVIFGCQRTKDFKVMLKELKPVISDLIVTKSSHPQAQDPIIISRRFPGRIARSLEEAILSWDQKSPLLITGSLFLVADALRLSREGKNPQFP